MLSYMQSIIMICHYNKKVFNYLNYYNNSNYKLKMIHKTWYQIIFIVNIKVRGKISYQFTGLFKYKQVINLQILFYFILEKNLRQKILYVFLPIYLLSPFTHLGVKHNINIQASRCVLGGKSQVKYCHLILTPPFRKKS